MKFHWFTIACLPTCWGGGCSTDVSMRMHLQRGLGARGSVTMGNVTGIVRRAKGGPPTMHSPPFPCTITAMAASPRCAATASAALRASSVMWTRPARAATRSTHSRVRGVCVCACACRGELVQCFKILTLAVAGGGRAPVLSGKKETPAAPFHPLLAPC